MLRHRFDYAHMLAAAAAHWHAQLPPLTAEDTLELLLLLLLLLPACLIAPGPW